MADVRLSVRSRRLARVALALAIGLPAAAAHAAEVPTGAAAASVATSAPASAADAVVKFKAPAATPTAADPALEARMLAITGELRCLVCQNQTIADSHADLAQDLREEVRGMLKRGQSAEQIRRYMTDRYGDFILYRPPLKASTVVLWLGPGLLLVFAIGALGVVIARRARLGDDRFEPDPVWDGEAADLPAPPSSAAATQPGAPA